MKSCEEVARDVFDRREVYLAQKRRQTVGRNRITKALTIIAIVLSLILAAGCGYVYAVSKGVVSDIFGINAIVQSPEWASMSREERLAAVNAAGGNPEDRSTRELLEFVLNKPFTIDLFLFNSYDQGFTHVYNESPHLQELVTREDLGRVFLDFYRAIPVITDPQDKDLLDSLGMLMKAEVFAAQSVFTQNFSEAEMAELYQLVEEKYFEKKAAPDIYSTSTSIFYEAAGLPLPKEP